MISSCETESERKAHYFTLKVSDWLPDDKYRQLLAITIDKTSHWDPERRVNTFLIFAHKIPDAEKILDVSLAIRSVRAAELDVNVPQRPKECLALSVDADQQVVVVQTNDGTHLVPFAYIDTLWRLAKKFSVGEPRQFYEELGRPFKLDAWAFYGRRGIYHEHYYWPMKVLEHLLLVDESGAGRTRRITLTQESVACKDWREKLPNYKKSGRS